jgi:hypothetical protein
MSSCPDCGDRAEDSPETKPAAAGVGADPRCMTRLEIAELACRIMALWVFAQCALAIVPAIMLPFLAIFQHRLLDGLLGSGASLLVPLGELAFGVLLWRKARAIARRMVLQDPTPVVTAAIDSTSLMTVAFTAIGIYALWSTSDEFLRRIAGAFYMAQAQGLEHAAFWTDTRWKVGFIGTLGSLAFGLWLLFGSRGIVRFVQRVRGNAPAEEENTADNEAAK